MNPVLPIDQHLAEAVSALRAHGSLVLVAPPGSGKTTRVPPAILDSLEGGRVLVLQPRRVAARLVAERIAAERGVRLGEEVGYSVRFERRAGPDTRLEILTEGLLLRRLQEDPLLDGVRCVVLDEFHERSLHTDLALALLREVQQGLRPDLWLVAMSATMDAEPLAAWLGGCPIVRVEGQMFPVEMIYDSEPDERPIAARCAAAVRQMLPETGHTLVFLPGVREIEAVAAALGSLSDVELLQLHSRVPLESQARALAPSSRRKVVLSTNIAETSITFDGVRVVIDAGLVRVPWLDPAIGLERLETERVSAASAAQRAGRAGRTGPGRCRRLWTAGAQQRLAPAEAPEIERVDLCATALELRAWGVDPRQFAWFAAPPAASIERAESLLRRLGALGEGGLTPLGRTLAAMPVHPRLAAVVVEGHRRGCLRAAAGFAALASESDPGLEHGDVHERLRALDNPRGPWRLKQVRDQLVEVAQRALGRAPGERPPSDETLARVLLAGFPDRLGRRRGPASDRVRLVGGAGAVLLHPEQLGQEELLLAVELAAARRGERAEHRVTVAMPVLASWLTLRTERALTLDPERGVITATRRAMFEDLVLDERPDPEAPSAEALTALLSEAARAAPERALNLDDDARAFLERLRCLADWMPELELPTFEDLGPLIDELCVGRRSFAELRRVELVEEIRARLGFQKSRLLDEYAPQRLEVPSGAMARVSYTRGQSPVLSARIQQLFGMRETPRVAGGRVPVLVELLSPAQRPIQLTKDLASFWSNTYHEVRKEMRGRYPKWAWPEDPLVAIPEDRPRRRRD